MVVALSTSIVSLAAGAAGGYLFAKKKLEDEFNEKMEAEITATKEFYSRMHKKGEFSTPESAARKLFPEGARRIADGEPDEATLARVLKGLKYLDDGDVPEHIAAIKGEPPKVVTMNIFDSVVEDFENVDLKEIMDSRSPDVPYVLLRDEFLNNEREDLSQHTLTYFAEDDVLVDEKEKPIRDADKYVGEENLKKFGFLSGDKSVVYVRNEKLGMEYEILLSNRSYAEEVLGIPQEANRRKAA